MDMKMTGTEISIPNRLKDVIAEYDAKLAKLEQSLEDFQNAGQALNTAATVRGVYGQTHIDTGSVNIHTLKKNLVKSAWLNVYDGMDIKRLMSARDRNLFEQALEQMTEFNFESVKATFGDYIKDPRASVIRALAEVFSGLDPAFKSHDKVKIGVKGLPKRIIMKGFGQYCYGYGWDRTKDIINALAAFQNKPLCEHWELNAMHKDGDALLVPHSYQCIDPQDKVKTLPARGISLKRYKNGNGHIYFEPDTLRDINLALAEYYGDVLPDCHEEKPTHKATSTAVAKDLQYYPTPKHVVDRVLENIYLRTDNPKILEPSCGCGRFMDGIKKKWSDAEVFGVEYDSYRAEQARQKGHNVLTANFLEIEPSPVYDLVVMNPPFYGKHYAKHIEHALRFLKPEGVLVSVLPITARTDHGIVDGKWNDLPFGSFSESGTNINTTVLTIKKENK